MARDPSSTDLAADYDALVAQLTALRAEMSKLATEVSASASARGAEMAGDLRHGLQDARAYAGRKGNEAEAGLQHAVAANPFVALGLAAALGLLVGAVTRR